MDVYGCCLFMHIHAHVRNLLSSDVLLPRNSYLAVIHGGKARVKEKGVLRGVLGLLEGGGAPIFCPSFSKQGSP